MQVILPLRAVKVVLSRSRSDRECWGLGRYCKDDDIVLINAERDIVVLTNDDPESLIDCFILQVSKCLGYNLASFFFWDITEFNQKEVKVTWKGWTVCHHKRYLWHFTLLDELTLTVIFVQRNRNTLVYERLTISLGTYPVYGQSYVRATKFKRINSRPVPRQPIWAKYYDSLNESNIYWKRVASDRLYNLHV